MAKKNSDGSTPATHELTNMRVDEVSAVDRAANKRKFLVTKNDETPAETSARIQAKIAARGDAGPGVIDKADKGDDNDDATVPGTPAAHAHAASAHAAAASAHANAAAQAKPTPVKTEKSGDVVPLPGSTSVTTTAKNATEDKGTSVDPIAEMEALAKETNAEAAKVGASSTKKSDDVSLAVLDANGNVAATLNVSVDDAATATGTAAPAEVINSIKTALVGGIDAVSARIAQLRANILASRNISSTYGTPTELYDIWYIRDMLCALYDIGGPAWEVQNAADAAEDELAKAASEGKPVSTITKNKVITKARIMKMQAAHKAMEYAHADMKKVLKEMDSEGGDATGEVASATQATDGTPKTTNFEKSDGASKDIEKDPRFVALQTELSKAQTELKTKGDELAAKAGELKKAQDSVATLQALASRQAATLETARGSVGKSNKVVDNGSPARETNSDSFQWPRDLAADRSKIDKRF